MVSILMSFLFFVAAVAAFIFVYKTISPRNNHYLIACKTLFCAFDAIIALVFLGVFVDNISSAMLSFSDAIEKEKQRTFLQKEIDEVSVKDTNITISERKDICSA